MPPFEQDELHRRLWALGEGASAGTGIDLVAIDVRGAGRARLVRVYIDKPGGVTHGDCELISRRLGELLDAEDAVPGASYTLEVSSPGLDRKLTKPRDFERVVGQSIKVALREPLSGQKRVEGKLVAFSDETLAVETGSGDTVRVPLVQVQKANLKFDW